MADAGIIPVSGMGSNDAILGDSTEEHGGSAWLNYVSPNYFETLGTPVLAGRDFDGSDTGSSPKVAIVNQEFARKFLGAGNAIGKTFRIWEPPATPVPRYQVVGVVKDTKYLDLREETQPIMYFPVAQDEHPGPSDAIFIRSDSSLSSLVSSVKAVLREVNPAIDVDFRALKTQIRESLLQDRLMAALSGFFGLLAVLLAAIGLYGVISYFVIQRTNEIGIRMALGARRNDVLRIVLRDAGATTLAGLVVGTGLALAAAQVVQGLLFGLKPRDPLTIGLAVLTVVTAALLAACLPASRATKVDPMVALRYE